MTQFSKNWLREKVNDNNFGPHLFLTPLFEIACQLLECNFATFRHIRSQDLAGSLSHDGWVAKLEEDWRFRETET